MAKLDDRRFYYFMVAILVPLRWAGTWRLHIQGSKNLDFSG